MKKKFALPPFLLIALQGIFVCSHLSAQNVGIGTATPSEKLDVLGNLKFSGALMPNNNAGTTGRVLMSAGAVAAPTWGPVLTNPGATTSFGKMYSALSWSGNWNLNTYATFIITDPTLTNASAVSVSISGPWNSLYANIAFRSVVCEAGQLRITAVNTAGNITGAIPIALILFY